MGKAITIIQHHTQEELEKEIKRTKNGRYRLRIQTILLAMKKLLKELKRFPEEEGVKVILSGII